MNALRYTVDEDAVITYMGDFVDECDVHASAEALAGKIEQMIARYYPEFSATVTTARGPVATTLEFGELDADTDPDEWAEAINAAIDELWTDGNLWVIDKT